MASVKMTHKKQGTATAIVQSDRGFVHNQKARIETSALAISTRCFCRRTVENRSIFFTQGNLVPCRFCDVPGSFGESVPGTQIQADHFIWRWEIVQTLWPSAAHSRSLRYSVYRSSRGCKLPKRVVASCFSAVDWRARRILFLVKSIFSNMEYFRTRRIPCRT